MHHLFMECDYMRHVWKYALAEVDHQLGKLTNWRSLLLNGTLCTRDPLKENLSLSASRWRSQNMFVGRFG